MIQKIFKIVLNEIIIFIEIPIKYYPSSLIGNKIRAIYYKYKLNLSDYPLINNNVDFRGSNIKIGRDFKINKNCIIDSNGSFGIYIGNDVSIGPNVLIRSANHVFEDINTPINKQGWNCKKLEYKSKLYSVVIEDDVWIGANCVILSGAHIKQGSILGAATVISSATEENNIITGNKLRKINIRK